MPGVRLYLETSVWSHWFADDVPERRDATREFFQRSRDRADVALYVSAFVIEELLESSAQRAGELIDLVEEQASGVLEMGDEGADLAAAYAEHGAIPPGKLVDALHAAIATVNEMDALVSWNYRHFVNVTRRRKINAVNAIMGYHKQLEIITPLEAFEDEG